MIWQSIPVGMYHHVNENAGDFITVSTENFRRQMAWLRRENYETLGAEDLLAVLRGERRPARRCVVLTFDDAWLDNYVHAFPILKEFGHKFIIFVVSGWTDQAAQSALPLPAKPVFPTHKEAEKVIATGRHHEVICTWEQLREMQASGLASIENHTASHCRSGNLAPTEVRNELLTCQAAIQKNLGRASRQVCWPYGSHRAESLQVARELGMTTTYLVRRGINFPSGNSFALKRFTVDDHDEVWLERQLTIFSRPLRGFLQARLKPEKWFRKLK
jgi:peptidoglycan/xylan/chitin deacetylase (PgdA/CDA1 family)